MCLNLIVIHQSFPLGVHVHDVSCIVCQKQHNLQMVIFTTRFDDSLFLPPLTLHYQVGTSEKIKMKHVGVVQCADINYKFDGD